MRVVLELYADGDHIEGRLIPAAGGEPARFSGVLELLHVLEQFHPGPPPSAAGHADRDVSSTSQ